MVNAVDGRTVTRHAHRASLFGMMAVHEQDPIAPAALQDRQAPAPAIAAPSMAARLEQARRFDAFVNRFRRPLLQYFRRRGIAPADLEDMVQTVFLRLLRKLQLGDDSLSDAYVFTTASSVLVDHYRRRTSDAGAATVEIDPDFASEEPDARQILEDRQTLRVMLNSLMGMSAKWRRAFMLHRFDQLSYADIARKMGISASSVEKYVMAALAELRDSTDRDRHD
jgi:RNA polymerase sigma factor (sigma-70 family)